jgi:hypothetical protein
LPPVDAHESDLLTCGPDKLENLVSRAAYDSDEVPLVKWRLALAVGLLAFVLGGLFFGILFPLAFELVGSLIFPSPVRTFKPETVVAAGLGFGIPFGLVLGLVFGWFFPAAMRRGIKPVRDAIYAGDPKIAEFPPDIETYSHRLPCSWIKGPSVAVGGVLYLSRERFMFVPHKRNLASHRKALEIAPLTAAGFSLVEAKPWWLFRLIAKNLPLHVKINYAGSSERFLVPQPAQTIVKMMSVAEGRQPQAP